MDQFFIHDPLLSTGTDFLKLRQFFSVSLTAEGGECCLLTQCCRTYGCSKVLGNSGRFITVSALFSFIYPLPNFLLYMPFIIYLSSINHLSVHLSSIFLCMCMYVCMYVSIYLSIYLSSIYLLFIYQSIIYLPIRYLSINHLSFIYQFIIYLSIYLSTNQPSVNHLSIYHYPSSICLSMIYLSIIYHLSITYQSNYNLSNCPSAINHLPIIYLSPIYYLSAIIYHLSVYLLICDLALALFICVYLTHFLWKIITKSK
jgi:hypothetical protein